MGQSIWSLLPPVHVGTQLCVPVHRLMETAREMTRESLPIKCLEAVILAMYPDRGGGGSGGGNLLGLPVTSGTLRVYLWVVGNMNALGAPPPQRQWTVCWGGSRWWGSLGDQEQGQLLVERRWGICWGSEGGAEHVLPGVISLPRHLRWSVPRWDGEVPVCMSVCVWLPSPCPCSVINVSPCWIP